MPKVSVIMPVYNVEDYVEPSMRSLLDQTERDIEIIAVNDGSTDGSLLRCCAGWPTPMTASRLSTRKTPVPRPHATRG